LLVGLIGMSAVWVESPLDSGALKLLRGRKLKLPYSKTRAYVLMAGMGSLATLISSVLDHARTGFMNPWLWISTAGGALGTIAAITPEFIEKPNRRDVRVSIGAMVLMLLTGLACLMLHIQDDLTAQDVIVVQRCIRGAPILAPLHLSNMGMIGLTAIWDPR